jgi:hypothetical protein
LKGLTGPETMTLGRKGRDGKLPRWLSCSLAAAVHLSSSSLDCHEGSRPRVRGATEAVAFAMDFSAARGDSPIDLNRA